MAHNKLIEAARRGEGCRIRKLLAAPEGPTEARRASKSTGKTALMIAAEQGHPDCVRALAPFSCVLETDRRGFDALRLAADANQAECVRALLESEALAWPSSQSAWRTARSVLTALDAACGLGHDPCVRAFLETPIGRAAARSDSGIASPLHSAAGCARPGRLACIEALLAIAPGAARRSWLGRSPLMRAAEALGESVGEAGAQAVQLLLPSSNPLAVDDDGQTALLLAVKTAHHAAVKILAPAGGVGAADAKGDTALMHAARLGDIESVRLLLPASDLAATNNEGRTALDEAVSGEPNRARFPWEKEAPLDHSVLACVEAIAARCALSDLIEAARRLLPHLLPTPQAEEAPIEGRGACLCFAYPTPTPRAEIVDALLSAPATGSAPEQAEWESLRDAALDVFGTTTLPKTERAQLQATVERATQAAHFADSTESSRAIGARRL